MASSSSFSPSPSSSPTKKKTLFPKPTRLTKRQVTVFKKAYELSTLCGIDVCVICYDSNGELKTWPKDREKVKDMARKYMSLNETNRSKKRVNLREFLDKINKDDSSSKNKKVRLGTNHHNRYQDWDSRFDNYSVEQLEEVIQSLELNLTRIQHRLNDVLESKKQRNLSEQEQKLTIASTMNHHHHHLHEQQQPQHSNHVSMYLFNHENGTLSRVPVSTTGFNQAQQSIAPTPLTISPNLGLLGVQERGIDELMKTNMLTYNNNVSDYSKQDYQNFKVEDYSGYLGVQGTGIDEFQNPNVFGFNNNLNNINMGNYPGLLGMQGTSNNGLQNMNMTMQGYDKSSNTNGVSNQFVQFQTQIPGQGFQFGVVRSRY